MKAVFLDTAPLIYLIEGTGQTRDLVEHRLTSWIESDVSLHSSVLTLAELLVPAKRKGDSLLASRYKSALCDLLSAPLRGIDESQAEMAAEIRAGYAFSTPDALQLAAALSIGCDCFYTNDRALRKFRKMEIALV